MSGPRFLQRLLIILPVAATIWIFNPAGWADGRLGGMSALADDDDDDKGGDDDDDGDRRVRALRPDFVPGEVLLLNPSEAGLTRSQALGFTIYSREIIAGLELTVARLRPPQGLGAINGLALLRREIPEEVSDLNHLYRPQACRGAICSPSAWLPESGTLPAQLACPGQQCYGQRMVGWTAELAACGHGVRIGLVDTGIDARHPALAGQRIKTVSFAPALTSASPTRHGTAVLALLAGKPGSVAPGLLPHAEFFAADVFHAAGANGMEADAVSVARGLAWLKSERVSVINLSLAGPENRLVEAAVGTTMSAGIQVVAAVGNDGPSAAPRHPAALPGVIGVTGVDSRLRAYRSAGQGPQVDYAAPGVAIWTAGPRGRGGLATGTSFAAPFVAAILAISGKGAADEKSGDAAAAQDLGAAGRDPVFGMGLIQAPLRCRPTLAQD